MDSGASKNHADYSSELQRIRIQIERMEVKMDLFTKEFAEFKAYLQTFIRDHKAINESVLILRTELNMLKEQNKKLERDIKDIKKDFMRKWAALTVALTTLVSYLSHHLLR